MLLQLFFSLRWSKKATIDDNQMNYIIWNKRSELIERLLAQKCELCGSREKIEVHHIRKLADIAQKPGKDQPEWIQNMLARRRKTLVVCLECHKKIHSGRYDGQAIKR